LAFAFVTASIASFVACGGNVVVDGPHGSGTGGTTTTHTQSGTGGVTTQPGVGGTGVCGLPNASTLTPCGGTGSSGGMCSFAYCGSGGETWEADCTATTCQCAHNGAVVCTCALTGPGDICSGTPDCCFQG
jgi:hypothetical protein